MENKWKVYNEKGNFLVSYGLGWNIAEIMLNKCKLVGKTPDKVELIINGKVVHSVTRKELIDSL